MGWGAKNYFNYLPDPVKMPPWECVVVSVGHTRVEPGSRYPVLKHPMDHHFQWADGRLLSTCTMVCIAEGGGVFESAASPRRHRIEAGTVFLVFPDIWHRYAPDPVTGWVEHWIEFRGPAFDRAMATGLVNPARPVFRAGPDLLSGFERCHVWAERPWPQQQEVLSSMALHLLALIGREEAVRKSPPRRIDEIVRQAQLLIEARCQENISMQKLAAELHVGYSHFRQAFREHCGLGPKQFHARARWRKAREFLANTSKSVKEIAELLGFHSAFHFSTRFKMHEGVSPRVWRERLQRDPLAQKARRARSIPDPGR